MRSGLEAACFVEAFFFQCGDCYAFFFADGRAAFEGHGPLVGVKVRGVEEHIRRDHCVYECKGDVDESDVFHARLDGVGGF